MSLEWRQRRIAHNEACYRDINERLEKALQRVDHLPEQLEFICECGDRACDAHITLTLAEYEEIRRDSRRFAVVPGHVFPEAERVVATHERYEVVEKFGAAADLTDAADKRERGLEGRRADDP